MVVAEDNGRVVAHMLATLRRRGSLIPPYLFTQGRIYGEGEYDEDINKEIESFKETLDDYSNQLADLKVKKQNLSKKLENNQQTYYGKIR